MASAVPVLQVFIKIMVHVYINDIQFVYMCIDYDVNSL
jgi:hypothetical protein